MTTGVLIVGLGQIGMGYDTGLDPATCIFTHARAFHLHPAFQLLGGVDPDAGARQRFEQLYGVPAFADIDAGMGALRPALVVIAVPTQGHAAAVRAVLQAGSPATLLCEKPLSFALSEARAIVAACKERECQLYVNYIRRAEPGVAEVRRRLLAGEIGQPVRGVVWYTKGLFNNGSHFVDLLQYWLGDVHTMRLLAAGRKWNGIDPEPDFIVQFESADVTFLALREENFSHHTVELLARNGRLRYEQGGAKISWQQASADPAYAGYATLEVQATNIATDFGRTQWHVADQLAERIQGRAARLCSGADALRTVEILTAIGTNE